MLVHDPLHLVVLAHRLFMFFFCTQKIHKADTDSKLLGGTYQLRSPSDRRVFADEANDFLYPSPKYEA